MAKYKIIKKPGMSEITDRYLVYRKGWFFWHEISSNWTQTDAERSIELDKKARSLKNEVVGYY